MLRFIRRAVREHSPLFFSCIFYRYRVGRIAQQCRLKEPDKAHLLGTLAALSHQTSFSVGCYCADESRCHRSVLRGLLGERGAAFVA